MNPSCLTITVYAGSGPGNDPAFTKAGHDLGEIFCREKIAGIFGGGTIGIMGAFSSSMISHGGNVTAVIPKLLVEREQPIVSEDTGVSESGYRLIVTNDMYERKLRFRDADGFIALPGGAGTRDEIWEEITGIQIGDHKKPIVLVNILGCFDHLLTDIHKMRQQGFIRPALEFAQLFRVVTRVEDAVRTIRRLLGETNVVTLPMHREAAG